MTNTERLDSIEKQVDELDLIGEIVTRALRMAEQHGYIYDCTSLLMDMTSAHKQIPMDLKALRDAEDFNFAHDVFGIANHMDRTDYPGSLTGCFVPRFALPQDDKGE